MNRAGPAVAATVVGLIALLRYEPAAPETPAAVGVPPSVSSPAPTAGAGTSAPPAGDPPADAAARTLIGNLVDTDQGPVQVQVTLTGGELTDVTVLVYPNSGGRDTEINSVAVPQLVQAALAAQGADIQFVSGASYTSQGFVASLQSALDQA